MCILFLYLNDRQEDCPYRLIVANNRDEYWDRPTATAAFRGEKQQWIGGMDLVPGSDGGTWLGLSKTGKFGVLLNILAKEKRGMKRRGHWVRDFLEGEDSCEDYMKTISSRMGQCNPFQYVCSDLSKTPGCVHYISNGQGNKPRELSTGFHSFDNSSLNSPWKKTLAGEEHFKKIVYVSGLLTHEELVGGLVDLLNDKTQYHPDPQLTQQFMERYGNPFIEEELKQNTAVCVWSPSSKCGTRTNTVILVDFDGNCDFYERTLDTPVNCDNPTYSSLSYSFKLDLEDHVRNLGS